MLGSRRLAALLLALLPSLAHAGPHGPNPVADSMAIGFDGGRVTLTISPPAGPEPSVLLIPLQVPPAAVAVDPGPTPPLAELLWRTSPVLAPTLDTDPCFPHPPAPPPPPFGLSPPAPNHQQPQTIVLPPSPDAVAAWAHAHGLHHIEPPPLSTAGSVLVIISEPNPPGTAPPPVRVSFPASVLHLYGSSLGAHTLLLVSTHGQPIRTSPGITPLPVPPDPLPEFVLHQFGWFLTAVERRLSHAPALVQEFSGWQPAAPPGLWVTRLHPIALAGSDVEVSLEPHGTPGPLRAAFHTRIAWKGQYTLACSDGFEYRHAVTAHWQQEADTLASLTGWQLSDIRRAMVADWQAHREQPPD